MKYFLIQKDFEELRPVFVSPETIQNTEKHLTETVSALRTGDLECPLCLRIYWDPDVTPCGHTFCSNCLERTLDHDPKCPLCKQSLVEFLELRQGAKREDFTDKQLTCIIRRWLPEEHQDRFEAVSESSTLVRYDQIAVKLEKTKLKPVGQASTPEWWFKKLILKGS